MHMYRRSFRNIVLSGIAAACVCGPTFGMLSYKHEKVNDWKIPIVFSEYTELGNKAQADGRELSAATSFHAGLFDFANKVLEAYVNARSQGSDFHHRFARELKYRMETYARRVEEQGEKAHRRELVEFFAEIPQSGRKLLAELSDYLTVSHSLQAIRPSFEASWTEYHDDDYELVPVTHTSTDNNGNVTVTVSMESQYDHTHHSYSYHQHEGESAARDLARLIDSIPRFSFDRYILFANKIQEPNRKAIEWSRRYRDEKALTENEMVNLAASWWQSSSLKKNDEAIQGSWGSIRNGSELWKAQKLSATLNPERKYVTHSRHDNGPVEYQTVEQIIKQSNNLSVRINSEVDAINQVVQKLPVLEDKVREYIDTVLNTGADFGPFDENKATQLSGQILGMTREFYRLHIDNGLELDPFRSYMIFVYSLLGITLGAAFGTGGAALVEKFRQDKVYSTGIMDKAYGAFASARQRYQASKAWNKPDSEDLFVR